MEIEKRRVDRHEPVVRLFAGNRRVQHARLGLGLLLAQQRRRQVTGGMLPQNQYVDRRFLLRVRFGHGSSCILTAGAASVSRLTSITRLPVSAQRALVPSPGTPGEG